MLFSNEVFLAVAVVAAYIIKLPCQLRRIRILDLESGKVSIFSKIVAAESKHVCEKLGYSNVFTAEILWQLRWN